MAGLFTSERMKRFRKLAKPRVLAFRQALGSKVQSIGAEQEAGKAKARAEASTIKDAQKRKTEMDIINRAQKSSRSLEKIGEAIKPKATSTVSNGKGEITRGGKTIGTIELVPPKKKKRS